eukprot:CAMPEP_0167754550 /NCGR_PEP_ID=MMETSP0110_2-20121227/8328_1 /TAXON_ID=629695 /ORGANISM="Gymnochlora sp., Strain CCMP2014" /LENGTH=246 /DNA_ID=CAMNT_0007640433 /DNA_START=129 /DNA_END=869 /DNA_ORIENTATION=-
MCMQPKPYDFSEECIEGYCTSLENYFRKKAESLKEDARTMTAEEYLSAWIDVCRKSRSVVEMLSRIFGYLERHYYVYANDSHDSRKGTLPERAYGIFDRIFLLPHLLHFTKAFVNRVEAQRDSFREIKILRRDFDSLTMLHDGILDAIQERTYSSQGQLNSCWEQLETLSNHRDEIRQMLTTVLVNNAKRSCEKRIKIWRREMPGDLSKQCRKFMSMEEKMVALCLPRCFRESIKDTVKKSMASFL